MAAVAVVFASAGCTIGAPPGFSDGDHWVLPLVGPLEDGVLITPVTIRGKGPYLFAIDPDANVSAIDTLVVQEAELRMGMGPRRHDETDTTQVRHYAEALDMKISGLTIDRRDIMVFPVGFYDTKARNIKGILGRDAVADSLVFGFDRDQGIATLMTTKAFTPPPGAMVISYAKVSAASLGGMPREAERQYDSTRLPNESRMPVSDVGDIAPIPRRLVTAQVGDSELTMHLDLGAETSQLRQNAWPEAGLSPLDLELRITDEAVIARKTKVAAVAASVSVGDARGAQVTFAPFIDKRFPTARMDGTLGLDFFRGYAVYAHWDDGKFFLKSRGEPSEALTARLGRWGNAFTGCPNPACVTAELVASSNGPAVRVRRDAEAASRPIEVYLGVSPAAGRTAPAIVVELPPNVNEVVSLVPAAYDGAKLTVLDASPFTRPCTTDGGCIMPVTGPGDAGDAVALDAPSEPASAGLSPPEDAVAAPVGSPAPPAAQQKTVNAYKLTRTAGDAAIAPSADAKAAAGGKPFGAAILRVCLAPDGKVDSVKLVKSSGVPAYDQQLQDTIKATWAFASGIVDGLQACTAATFAPRS